MIGLNKLERLSFESFSAESNMYELGWRQHGINVTKLFTALIYEFLFFPGLLFLPSLEFVGKAGE
jgi:hypothetical protein